MANFTSLNNQTDPKLKYATKEELAVSISETTQILEGNGVPSEAIGKAGDVFIDKTNAFLYGPKLAVATPQLIFTRDFSNPPLANELYDGSSIVNENLQIDATVSAGYAGYDILLAEITGATPNTTYTIRLHVVSYSGNSDINIYGAGTISVPSATMAGAVGSYFDSTFLTTPSLTGNYLSFYMENPTVDSQLVISHYEVILETKWRKVASFLGKNLVIGDDTGTTSPQIKAQIAQSGNNPVLRFNHTSKELEYASQGNNFTQISNLPPLVDATTSVKGKIKLAGDLAGTADLPTVPGLASKAPLASPAFTGTPTSPTATPGTNTTQIASTAFVTDAVSSATIPDATTSVKGKVKLAGDLAGTADLPTVPGLANKANIASPTFTGIPSAPTASPGTNTAQIASTSFVTTAVAAAGGEKAKITATDTAAGFLNDKVVGGIGKIVTTVINQGFNETLEISLGPDIFDKTINTTDALTEGSLNKFYSTALFNANFANKFAVDLSYNQNSPSDWTIPQNSNVKVTLDSVGSRIKNLESSVGLDEKTKASATDTAPGFLTGKLSVTSGKLIKTIVDPGANEVVNINIGADVFDKTSNTTDNITEGTKKFYSTSLFNADFATKVANDLNYTQAVPANWTVAQGSSIKVTLDSVGSRIKAIETAPQGQARVSATDTTSGFLLSKLQSDATKITINVANPGGNETILLGIGSQVFNKVTDTTDNILEGTGNKFFTQAQFNDSFSGKTTDALAEGSINRYYSQALFNTDFNLKNASNLNFTQAIPSDWTVAQGSSIKVTLDSIGSRIKNNETVIASKVNSSLIGVSNGICPLNGSAKISTLYLPAFVDSVVEYATLASFPGTGVAGTIYVALNTNKTYRWSGSTYIEIAASDVNSVNGKIGLVVLKAIDLTFTQATTTNWTLAQDSSVKATLDEVGSRVKTVETQVVYSAKSLQDPIRLDSKKDTKANLTTYSSSAANGQFAFATDEKKMYQIIDSQLAPVGGDDSIRAIAGENLSANQLVYISTGTGNDSGRIAGRAYKVDVTNDDRIEAIGITYTVITAGSEVEIKILGAVKTFSGLTVGKAYFASATNPGNITTTAPTTVGQWVITVGVAVSATTLALNPCPSAGAIFINDNVDQISTIANNQTADVSVVGMIIDPIKYRGARIEYYMTRKTDTGSSELSHFGEMNLSYNQQLNIWSLTNRFTGQDAGVLFSAQPSGQVFYKSSNMAGSNYTGTIKWLIAKTFEV